MVQVRRFRKSAVACLLYSLRIIFLSQLFSIFAFAQSTSVSGTYRYPDGTAFNGTLTLKLPIGTPRTSSLASCGSGTTPILTASKSYTITNGNLPSISLWPNGCLLPIQPYVAVVSTSNSTLATTNWCVPVSGGSVDVSAVQVAAFRPATFTHALGGLTNIVVTNGLATANLAIPSGAVSGAVLTVSGSATSALNNSWTIVSASNGGSTFTFQVYGVSNGTYADAGLALKLTMPAQVRNCQ